MGDEWTIEPDVAEGERERILGNARYQNQEVDCFGQKGTKYSFKLCRKRKPVLYFRWNFDEMEGVTFEQEYLQKAINGRVKVDRDLSPQHLFQKNGVFWEKYKGQLSNFQELQIQRKLADQIALVNFAKEYKDED